MRKYGLSICLGAVAICGAIIALAGSPIFQGPLSATVNISNQVVQVNLPNGGNLLGQDTISPSTTTAGVTTAVMNGQLGSYHKYTITNNTAWTFVSAWSGVEQKLQITQNTTGGYTNAWPTSVTWKLSSTNGLYYASPTARTNASTTAVYKFTWDGTTYFGSVDIN